MAESSLFAQRLQAITERRRLQERILATRRELEEERLRAQRLKRKSLRDRWLMEGMSSPTDNNDHLSSVWEAQNRIQELEQDLSSLQTQMQRLDNPELHQGLPQPEEPVKGMKEVKRSSFDGIGEVDGTSSSPPEDRSSPESRFELAPVPSKRPQQATAEEKLQNGDMPGGGVFGSECSPEKAEVDVTPIAEEGGDAQPPQRSPEAAADMKLACQSLGLSEVSPNCPRKLAVEEMVIRDHLGQEVGSMDAVGQMQSSIGKEEDLEGNPDLANEGEEGSKPNHLCSASSSVKAPGATENRGDSELGSRDGPEGESPTAWDHQSPSKALQSENSCLDSPKWRAEAELEMGSLAKEAELMVAGQKELPEQGAKEPEPPRGLAVGHAEPEMGAQENLSGESLGSWLDQPKLPLLDQIPDLEEAKMPLLDEVISSSSPLPDQIPATLQEQIPAPLQDQIPSSFQEVEGSRLEPLLPNQSLSTLSDQTAPLQERKELLSAPVLSPQQESLLDPTPPSLQDHLSSSPKENLSSLQGEATSLQDQIPLPLCEANGKPLDQIPASLQEQSAALPDQVLSPLLDQSTSLPGQIPSSLNEIEKSLQVSTTSQGQELSAVEAKGSFPDLIPSSSNQLTSLPDQINSLQEAEGLSLEEIPVVLQEQMPTALEACIPSLPEEDIILPGQIPFPVDEGKHLLPGESPASVPDPISQALLDQNPPFLEGAAPSYLQEAGGCLTDQMRATLPGETPPRLLEAKGQAQPMLTEQVPISPQGQATSLQEPEKPLPEKLEEVPLLPGQAPSPKPTAPDDLLLSSQNVGQPLLDKTVSVGNQELKEVGDASLISTAEEAKEVLHAEQQPLLQEASADALDISVGDMQPKTGILKLQAATNQETPTYTTTSANTASSCPLQPTAPRQGEDPEQGQSRRKQKSCQCCSVM